MTVSPPDGLQLGRGSGHYTQQHQDIWCCSVLPWASLHCGEGSYTVPISGSKLTLCRIRNHIFTWATEATEGLESVGSCISSHEQLPGFGREMSRSSASRVMGGEDGSVSGVPVRVDMAQCKADIHMSAMFCEGAIQCSKEWTQVLFLQKNWEKRPLWGSLQQRWVFVGVAVSPRERHQHKALSCSQNYYQLVFLSSTVVFKRECIHIHPTFL